MSSNAQIILLLLWRSINMDSHIEKRYLRKNLFSKSTSNDIYSVGTTKVEAMLNLVIDKTI
jgi:hypothetical protein